MTTAEKVELDELLALLREALLTPDQAARLGEILHSSDEALRAYIASASLQADLRGRLVRASLPSFLAADAMMAEEVPAIDDPGVLSADASPADIRAQETMYGLTITLPDDSEEEPVAAPAASHPPAAAGWPAGRFRSTRSRLGAVAALLALAVTLLAIFRAGSAPVATITAVTDARWAQSSDTPAAGDSVSVGTTLELSGGSVEMAHRDGARVTISGPARFTVAASNRVDLHSGRLSAIVPKAAVGFTVRAETVDVVDLGTEFDVAVLSDRSIAIRVAAGQVEARPAPDAAKPFDAVRIAAGESAVADASGVKLDPKAPAYATATPAGVTGGPSFPSDEGQSLPSRVLNSDPKSWWAGDPAKDSWELLFDFGAEVGIPNAKVDYFSRRYMAKQATLLTSSDGVSWRPVGDLPESNPAVLPVARPARYLKISFTGKVADKQPAIWSVTFPAAAELVAAAAAEPAKPDTVKGWPAGVTDVRYTSAGDNSEQPALFYDPRPAENAPLLVVLHTWSNDYKTVEADYARWCIERGWVMVRPNFRGPNKTPEACGSDLVVADILSAVDYAKRTTKVDDRRIYLVGVSGGGHAALLMAGRAPDVWAGVSAWCPIYDLAAWHAETAKANRPYWKMLEAVCGGPPGASAAVDAEYLRRSPMHTMAKASGVPLDINAGIHDGHTGSVPVSHSLRVFNALAAEAAQIPNAEIASIVATRKPPAGEPVVADELYERAPVLCRRTSGQVRVTLFEGGHMMVHEAAFAWLEQQQKGTPAVWKLKRSAIYDSIDGKAETGR